MACPQKTTGASSSGFACGNKGDGTSNWMPTPPRASSVFFLTKLKVNRRRAFFVNGRLKSEIRRHPAILGTLPGVSGARPTQTNRRKLGACQDFHYANRPK